MKWMAAKVCFTSNHPYLAVELISNVFYEFGLQGVLVEDADSADIPSEAGVTGYFPCDETMGARRQILESALLKLKAGMDLDYRIEYTETADEDWAECWKAFFKPQRVGRHLVVKPTWEEYRAEPKDIILEIDPGMAFGTGTHPTTELCLEMIEAYLKPGYRFLDIGTGSGILMIAAAKLKAKHIVGIDTDSVAVEVAKKNMNQNRIDGSIYQVKIGDLTRNIAERFDMVVANILTDAILILLDDLKAVVREKGIVILSGITESNIPRIHEKLAPSGFFRLETRIRESWAVCVAGVRS